MATYFSHEPAKVWGKEEDSLDLVRKPGLKKRKLGWSRKAQILGQSE